MARILETLDRERVTVASSIGIRARTALEWLKMSYDATGEDLNEAIHNQPGYYGIKAPPVIDLHTTVDINHMNQSIIVFDFIVLNLYSWSKLVQGH